MERDLQTLSVSALFLALFIPTTAGWGDGPTTCSAEYYRHSRSAIVNCHHDKELTQNTDGFFIMFCADNRPFKYQKAISCNRGENGRLSCISTEQFQGMTCTLTNSVTCQLPHVRSNHSGSYSCHLLPSQAGNQKPCRLNVPETGTEPPQLTTTRPPAMASPPSKLERGDGDKGHTLQVVAVVISSLNLAGILAIFVLLYKKRDRSQTVTRQSTLLSPGETARNGSQTPERGRAKDQHSPKEGAGKQPRRDFGRSDSPAQTDDGEESESETAAQCRMNKQQTIFTPASPAPSNEYIEQISDRVLESLTQKIYKPNDQGYVNIGEDMSAGSGPTKNVTNNIEMTTVSSRPAVPPTWPQCRESGRSTPASDATDALLQDNSSFQSGVPSAWRYGQSGTSTNASDPMVPLEPQHSDRDFQRVQKKKKRRQKKKSKD